MCLYRMLGKEIKPKDKYHELALLLPFVLMTMTG